MRRAKIVATIGPASSSPEKLRSLILSGMDVVRLNMAHGTHSQHATVIATARDIAAELKRPLAILIDLSGPKIRTGRLAGDQPVELTTGCRLTITTEDVPGNSSRISTTYARLPQDVSPGQRILLADGLIELVVEQTGTNEIHCRVLNGGILSSNKGINIPGATLAVPTLTEKDHADLRFGLEQGVDYVGLSFVRSARDLIGARTLVEYFGGNVPLIAKIEKSEALDDLDNIIAASDGVMVARGDLGVETAVERVPYYQKLIIARANAAEKVVITATQMLESMTHEPRPTRAEASDVANAILDGTDSVMMSAETATGAYPVEAVETMARIISYTETACAKPDHFREAMKGEGTRREGRAISEAAVFAAEEMGAQIIVVFSKSGTMARHIAALRPRQRIVAFTPHVRTCNALAAVWGLEPYVLEFSGRSAELLARADGVLVDEGLATPGQTIIIMAGRIPEQSALSSTMKLHRVANSVED